MFLNLCSFSPFSFSFSFSFFNFISLIFLLGDILWTGRAAAKDLQNYQRINKIKEKKVKNTKYKTIKTTNSNDTDEKKTRLSSRAYKLFTLTLNPIVFLFVCVFV